MSFSLVRLLRYGASSPDFVDSRPLPDYVDFTVFDWISVAASADRSASHLAVCIWQPARLIWSINGLVRDGASWVCVATVGCWFALKAHLCVFARQRPDLNSFKFVFCSHL